MNLVVMVANENESHRKELYEHDLGQWFMNECVAPIFGPKMVYEETREL